MIKAIIFDMDGVLFDTEPFYFKRRESFLKERQISIDHLSPKDFIGGNLQQVWSKILGDHFDVKEMERFNLDYEIFKRNHKAPYQDLAFPGLISLFEVLRKDGLQLALASNSNKGDILRALSTINVTDYFDVILGREDVKRSKPNAEIYLKASSLLQVPKEQTLVVEDSQKGIAAGKAAGMRVVAIKDVRYGIDQSQADFWVDDLSQLQALLKSLNL